MKANARQFFTNIGQVPLGLEKPSNEKAAIIATEKLTEGEEWQKFNPSDFLIFKNGEVAFSNGERQTGSESNSSWIKNIEVYDTSARLDNLGTKVIGIPKSLRDQIDVKPGDYVKVRNRDSDLSAKLCVHQTDQRLLRRGSCSADTPNCHVCIPPSVRSSLGLKAVKSSHRSSLQAFTRKFSPVDICKV